MYENESYESHAQSESDWTRDELELDAHLERQEARARRDQAEGLLELQAFNPRIAAPVAMALDGWLKLTAPFVPSSDYGSQPAYTAWAAAQPKPVQSVLADESEAA